MSQRCWIGFLDSQQWRKLASMKQWAASSRLSAHVDRHYHNQSQSWQIFFTHFICSLFPNVSKHLTFGLVWIHVTHWRVGSSHGIPWRVFSIGQPPLKLYPWVQPYVLWSHLGKIAHALWSSTLINPPTPLGFVQSYLCFNCNHEDSHDFPWHETWMTIPYFFHFNPIPPLNILNSPEAWSQWTAVKLCEIPGPKRQNAPILLNGGWDDHSMVTSPGNSPRTPLGTRHPKPSWSEGGRGRSSGGAARWTDAIGKPGAWNCAAVERWGWAHWKWWIYDH